MKCHLILRGKPYNNLDGNLLLDYLAGTSVTFATAEQFKTPDRLYADIEAEYRVLGERPFSIPIGASDEIGLWGYIECARELKCDFERLEIEPDFVISAAGSGGTMGGLIVGNALHELDTNIVAFNVCEDEAWFQHKISRDIQSWTRRYNQELADQPINSLDGYVGPGYGRADPHVYETISRVARTEGIILDPVYTGKAFDAFLQELANGRFRHASDIVFLHTGGIFGLFPHRDHFPTAQFTNETTPQP
jgi:D-cysteine desulfhydrase